MKIEHVAFNVEDPRAFSRWYVEHLGLTIKRQLKEAPWTHFLADDGGAVMLEIYGNPAAAVLDYRNMALFTLHLAFVSRDVEADARRLIAAGATLLGDIQHNPNGDVLANLRDPWGFVFQLVRRNEPMI